MERTISFMNGEGSLGHNTRAFIASNVHEERSKDNIVLKNENLNKVYHKIFDKSLEEYNAKQKRKDRKIKNYYDKIARSRQEKLFYEVIVQIGNREDTGIGSEAADVVVKILQDYVQLFERRNPQLYVFGAYIHMDEETPHVHLDFVPWSTGNKRGMETKNSLKGALASRGFIGEGKGNTEWQQWSEAEKEDIAFIMNQYEIGWKKLGTHKPHLSVLDYKKQERSREVKELEQELEDIGVIIELKEEREARLDAVLREQQIQIKREREEADKTLSLARDLKDKIVEDGIIQEQNNRLLQSENEELDWAVTDKKNELNKLKNEVADAEQVIEVAEMELQNVKAEYAEIQKLKQKLLATDDADYFLKEEVINLRYENRQLKEENRRLKTKLEKAYEFMKQFVIEGKSLLDKFMEWIGEKVRDVKGR